MRRRNFILGGGLLATLSLGATATNASLADSVAAAADFRVFSEPPGISAAITLDPSTQFTLSTHTWKGMKFTSSGQEITKIQADYGDTTNFDDVEGFNSVSNLTVRFVQQDGAPGNFDLVEVGSTLNVTNAAEATFDNIDAEIEDDASFDTNVNIEIDDFENPQSNASYEPTLTFVRKDGEQVTVDASFTPSTGDGEFLVTITDAPDEISAGSQAEIKAKIENDGAGEDSQDIILEVDGQQEDSESVTNLGIGDTTTVTLETEAVSGSKIEVVVRSEKYSDNRSISVVGGWSLNLNPNTGSDNSIHTWTTEGVAFEGDINEIIISYPEVDARGNEEPLNFEENDPDVTIEIGGDDDVVENETFNDHTATFELTDEIGIDETDIVINDLENPKIRGGANSRTYEATIELTGDDDSLETGLEFEIIK